MESWVGPGNKAVAKPHRFTAMFSKLSTFTADCLRHPIQMPGVETIWEFHTLTLD